MLHFILFHEPQIRAFPLFLVNIFEQSGCWRSTKSFFRDALLIEDMNAVVFESKENFHSTAVEYVKMAILVNTSGEFTAKMNEENRGNECHKYWLIFTVPE